MNITNVLPRLWILMRREMWENRIGFIWAPLVVSGIVVIMLFMTIFMVYQVDTQHLTVSDTLRLFASDVAPEEKEQLVGGAMLALQVLFGVVMFFVTVFYLLGALYDDRKDRSILFWKSLPVSDSMTVISKLASGSLLIPALFFLAIIATQLIVLIFASGYALMAGISPWSNVWAPAQLLTTWSLSALAYVVQALWLLPLWGWLLLCSSFAPRLPLLFAIGTPLLISWIQSYINVVQRFDFNSYTVMHYVSERITGAILPLSLHARIGDESFIIGFGEDSDEVVNIFDHLLTLQYLGERMIDPSLWGGMIIGVLFITAAVYFRRRATDQ